MDESQVSQPGQTDQNGQNGQTSPRGAGSNTTESTPLLQTGDGRPKNSRTVTFSSNPVTRTFEPTTQRTPSRSPHHTPGGPSVPASTNAAGQPAFAALNSKLRRRNSHTAVTASAMPMLGPKIGPQRSTKKTEKLKLLPNPELDEEEPEDEDGGRDVYSQYARIKDPNARRDAARLGKADRDRLPRVTAYCTANRYDMEALQRFFKGRAKTRGANPKLIDECLYSPYSYTKSPPQLRGRTDPVSVYERRHSTGGESIEEGQQRRETLMDADPDSPEDGYTERPDIDTGPLHTEELLGPSIADDDRPITDSIPDFDITVHTPEVFLFDYGVVVIWGMTHAQETRFLKDISKFELEKLSPDDVETEHFNFYYTREYQPRIYNDFITLRDKNNYMTKLAISHALAQSVKVHLPPSDESLKLGNMLTRGFADISLRGADSLNRGDMQGHSNPDCPERQDFPEPHPDQHADWRAFYPPHQHPPQRLRARHAGALLGRAPA